MQGHEVRVYDYVNHPYEQVRDALKEGALEIFRSATSSASSRAGEVASALKVRFGSIEIATKIRIKAAEMEELPGTTTHPESMKLDIEWEAAEAKRFFPLMRATLAVYPHTPTETQLELYGSYDPPMGPLGDVVNKMIGRRVAEACVHRFIEEIAVYLRKTLAG